jgi:hypothetical protein
VYNNGTGKVREKKKFTVSETRSVRFFLPGRQDFYNPTGIPGLRPLPEAWIHRRSELRLKAPDKLREGRIFPPSLGKFTVGMGTTREFL